MHRTLSTAGLRETVPSINHVPAAGSEQADPRQRRAEIAIAALFLLTALSSIPAAFTLDPLINAPDSLATIAPNATLVALDALLWSFNNIGIVFIAVFAFPLLRRFDETLAVGYLVSRVIEGSIMMVGIMATLALIPLSREFIAAGVPEGSWFLTVGSTLQQIRVLGLTGVSLPLLGLGGCLFTWLVFRERLVPRAIAAWGLLGYALVFTVGLAGWFGIVDPSPGGNVAFLAIPVASFEILLLPFWLLIRGFRRE